jgi:hypothetical protein
MSVVTNYIDACRAYNQADALKKKLRPEVLSLIKEEPIPEIELSTRQKIVFNDDEFYAWVSKEFPDQLEELTTKTINYVKFEELYASGKIVYESLPENIYTYKIEEVLRIK